MRLEPEINNKKEAHFSILSDLELPLDLPFNTSTIM